LCCRHSTSGRSSLVLRFSALGTQQDGTLRDHAQAIAPLALGGILRVESDSAGTTVPVFRGALVKRGLDLPEHGPPVAWLQCEGDAPAVAGRTDDPAVLTYGEDVSFLALVHHEGGESPAPAAGLAPAACIEGQLD